VSILDASTSTPVLTSFRNGLGGDEAATRLAANGPNRLKDGKKVSVFEILLRQVSNSLTFVLAIVMVLSFSLGDWIEGAVVAAVVLVNVVVGYVMVPTDNSTTG
jgi:Na+-exporting ATPase